MVGRAPLKLLANTVELGASTGVDRVEVDIGREVVDRILEVVIEGGMEERVE